jgi:hypothetical protein
MKIVIDLTEDEAEVLNEQIEAFTDPLLQTYGSVLGQLEVEDDPDPEAVAAGKMVISSWKKFTKQLKEQVCQ